MSEFNYPCPACGQSILSESVLAGTETTCPLCHASVIVPVTPVVPETTAESAAESPRLETPPPFTGYSAGTAPKRTSGLAIASLVCSLASLVTCVGWLPGIICGHMAVSRMRRDSSLKGRGLAKAGLAIGYSILLLEVAAAAVQVWVVSSAVKKAAMIARQELATNTIVITRTQTAPAAAVNPPPQAAAGWASDISTVPFPSQPVAGKLHGMDFILKTAVVHAANLRLTSEDGLELEIFGLDQPVEGQNYLIQPTDAGANPQVKMTWSEGGAVQSTTFAKGYGLKLQFGQAKNRRVSGNIYLCLPDDSKSWFAGTFALRLPKAAAKPMAP